MCIVVRFFYILYIYIYIDRELVNGIYILVSAN